MIARSQFISNNIAAPTNPKGEEDRGRGYKINFSLSLWPLDFEPPVASRTLRAFVERTLCTAFIREQR